MSINLTKKLLDWLKKPAECKHYDRRLTTQPYEGTAHYHCPSCGKNWTEYDQESDLDVDQP